MAMTVTARGTYTNNTSATTSTMSPSGNFAVGSFAALVIAADNSASGGSSNNINSVTDSLGNTWTKRSSPLYDPGAANAGVQGAVFTTPMGKGRLLTSTVITVTFGVATVADCGALWEIIPSANYHVVYSTQGVNTGSSTTTPTVTTASIGSGQTLIGGLYDQYGTTQVVTADADSSNGTWSTQQAASIGSTTSGMTVQSQYKVVTGTATQTYNPTLGTSSAVILSWASFYEDPNTLVTPGIATLTTARFTPSVTLGSAGITVTPGLATLVISRFTPTVSAPRMVVPGTKSLTTNRFTPIVLTPRISIPGTKSLTTSRFAPTVLAPRTSVPGIAHLTTSRFAPAVSAPRMIVPGKATLTTARFVPSVLSPRMIVPGVGSVVFMGYAPSVLTPRLVSPGMTSLVLTLYAPSAEVGVGGPIIYDWAYIQWLG